MPPAWLVEIVPALLFSVALQVLGFVLVGFSAHGSEQEHLARVVAASAPEPDESEKVVNWVQWVGRCVWPLVSSPSCCCSDCIYRHFIQWLSRNNLRKITAALPVGLMSMLCEFVLGAAALALQWQLI
jgi:hypothetical protein